LKRTTGHIDFSADFAHHEMVVMGPDRLLFRARTPYDWFEVTPIARGRQLVITGDIDAVVFGNYSPSVSPGWRRSVRDLQAEKGALEKMLKEIPIDHVIDRIGLESRKREIDDTLASQPDPHAPPSSLLACLIHWIGRATIDYAAKKANIGMTCQELVYDYPIEAMTEDLHAMETPDEYSAMGRRVSLRVQKAHAALRRASDLLASKPGALEAAARGVGP